MNRNKLIQAVARRSNRTQDQLREDLNLFIEEIIMALVRDEKVKLMGFGKFYLRDRLQRNGFDPYEQVPITIAGGKQIKFEPSESLKEIIRDAYTQPIVNGEKIFELLEQS